jgi:hypothetical protein
MSNVTTPVRKWTPEMHAIGSHAWPGFKQRSDQRRATDQYRASRVQNILFCSPTTVVVVLLLVHPGAIPFGSQRSTAGGGCRGRIPQTHGIEVRG